MSDPIRKATVSGQFYPGSCAELSADIDKYNLAFDKMNIKEEVLNTVPRAVIVPHAGYIYSGFTANIAYRFLAKAKTKRIVVIGPSHHHYFKGLSASHFENYETPCGNIEIDSPYLFALAKQFNIGFEPKAHQKEHSTEVQMPFIKHYFPQSKVIELIYGDIQIEALEKILYALLSNPDNLIVISTDLSHFHTIEVAKKLDYSCLKAVEKLDVNVFKESCEACGLIGMQALILAAKKHKLNSKLLDYRTSADASNDNSSVVGYMSAILY
jgi:AmmeMemoRadiSam system protein B